MIGQASEKYELTLAIFESRISLRWQASLWILRGNEIEEFVDAFKI